MPTTRFTINLPETEVDFLKKYAKKNRTTVAELVNRWIKGLKPKPKPAIHPEIERFTGIIPPDADVDKAISDYVMGKHR
ncbi:MAG: hypothetical protein KAW12_10300 [Candidatus Aminicenantes bacterium]|nr:hypothetical protein [Candidatus Aminicenantes bacterium]